MPRVQTATERGLDPHWKVRVIIPGAILHLASWTEPKIDPAARTIAAHWIDQHEYGDTIGWIDWTQVAAITWRWAP